MRIPHFSSSLELFQNRVLLLQVLHSFFTSIFVSIFFSVATIEFVGKFEKSFLPVGYFFSGIIGYAIIIAYGKFFSRLGNKAFYIPHAFMLLCAALFWFGFLIINPHSFYSKALSFMVYLFCTPFIYLASNQQAGLLIKTFNLKESKQYAGVISSAGTLAYIVGYFSVPTLTHVLGSNLNLLWVASIGLLIGYFILIKIVQDLDIGINKGVQKGKQEAATHTYRELLGQKFILFIALSGGLSTIAYYFVDYGFLVNSQITFADKPDELATFIGYFLSLVKIFEFLLGVYASRFFRAFGLKSGLVVLPFICLAFILFSILSSFNPSHVYALTGFVFALKFLERIFKKSIEEPAYKNLYQILEPAERLSILAKIEGGTKQISVIIGSLALIAYGALTPSEYLQTGILYISLVLFVIWVYFALKLVNAYKEKIKHILEAKHLNLKSTHMLGWEKLQLVYTKASEDLSIKKAINTFLGNKFFLNLKQVETSPEELSATESTQSIKLEESLFILPPKDDYQSEKVSELNHKYNIHGLFEMAIEDKVITVETLNVLKRKLNEAKHSFEKRLILNIIGKTNNPSILSYLLSLTHYPDYYIKSQAYYFLEHHKFKISESDIQHFYTNLERCLEELTYLISILNSIPEDTEFKQLHDALKEEEYALENRILSILTWKFDQASIMAIRENVFSPDQDSNLLALELIDNLLNMEIKDKILTIFNKSADFRRLQLLNRWYFYPVLKLEEALISLLNSDYTKIGGWSKACALKQIGFGRSPVYFSTLKSYLFHPNTFLRSLAFQNLHSMISPEKDDYESKRILSILNSKENSVLPDADLIFDMVKHLQRHPLFNGIPSSELIPLASGTEVMVGEHKKTIQMDSNLSPYLVLYGYAEIGSTKGFGFDLNEKRYLGPDLFGNNKIHSVKLSEDSYVFSFNSVEMTHMIVSSDLLLYNLLEETQ
ncbi:MAG: MFS transporter [Flavobacteriales bacterium]|nr:MFS transporter [Flavobacteriales bacterium]